jgi:hypothetical protein
MSIARVTVTLPASLLRQLDRTAGKLDRSRSWCVAEAVRRFVTEDEARRPTAPAAVRERAPVYAEPTGLPTGLGEQRLHQLTADLALTPAERVRAADATSRVGLRPRRGPDRIIQFDRYEDYLEWQKGEGLLW